MDLLIDSAHHGCDAAKYRLGKMFLRGEDVTKDIDYALVWLEAASTDGNRYAEQLLHSIKSGGNRSAALGTTVFCIISAA